MIKNHGDLRAVLRQLPAPEPSLDLLQRILRSRAMGVRFSIPARRLVVPWRWMAAAAAVVALVGGTWVLSLSVAKMGESRFAGRDPLAELRELMPQQSRGAPESPGEAPLPKYSIISSETLDPSRLMEGVWTYQSETTTDRVLTTQGESIRFGVAHATFDGHPSWMVTSARQFRDELWGGPYTDTTYLDAVSLRPRYTVVHANKGRTRLVQNFSADSGSESIEFPRVQKSRRSAIAFPFSRNALFVNDWSLRHFPAVLPALPLERGWRGTLYQVVFISQPGDVRRVVPLDLRVVGTDRVTVPAGTFDCWRLDVEINVGEIDLLRIWVSRDKGWLVKLEYRGSDYVRNQLLQSYEPGR